MSQGVQNTLEPTILTPLLHEYALPSTGQFITDLRFHTHPLVINVNFLQGYTVRLATHDIEKVEFVIDQQVIYTAENAQRDDVSGLTLVEPVHTVPLLFYGDNRLVTAALPPVKLRVTFWRAPVTPLGLTCTVNFIDGDTWTGQVLPMINGSGQVYHYWNKMVWFAVN